MKSSCVPTKMWGTADPSNPGPFEMVSDKDVGPAAGVADALHDNMVPHFNVYRPKDLSHLIIGGSDSVVVPSRFEPCGLTQLYALRYGALPLVRRTGGLADTEVNANAVTLAEGSATGFVFDDENPDALLGAAQRAAALYGDRGAWARVMRQAMTRDFSWEASARQYLQSYRELAPAS